VNATEARKRRTGSTLYERVREDKGRAARIDRLVAECAREYALQERADATERRRSRGKTARRAGDAKAPLTRDSSETVIERARRDRAFAAALFDEALARFFGGEALVARVLLRDLVDARVGFEKLAPLTGVPAKRLRRMLSSGGNPRMDDFSNVVATLRQRLGGERRLRAAPAARLKRIRKSIAAAIASADRGEAKPLDIKAVVDEIMARRAAMRGGKRRPR